MPLAGFHTPHHHSRKATATASRTVAHAQKNKSEQKKTRRQHRGGTPYPGTRTSSLQRCCHAINTPTTRVHHNYLGTTQPRPQPQPQPKKRYNSACLWHGAHRPIDHPRGKLVLTTRVVVRLQRLQLLLSDVRTDQRHALSSLLNGTFVYHCHSAQNDSNQPIKLIGERPSWRVLEICGRASFS